MFDQVHHIGVVHHAAHSPAPHNNNADNVEIGSCASAAWENNVLDIQVHRAATCETVDRIFKQFDEVSLRVWEPESCDG